MFLPPFSMLMNGTLCVIILSCLKNATLKYCHNKDRHSDPQRIHKRYYRVQMKRDIMDYIQDYQTRRNYISST